MEPDQVSRGQDEEQDVDHLFDGLDIRPDMSEAEVAELKRRLNPTKEDAGLALVERWFKLIDDLVTDGTPYKKVLLAMLKGREKHRFKEVFGQDYKKLGRTYAKLRITIAKG